MIKTKTDNGQLTVKDFLEFLKDCRPDAEVFTALFVDAGTVGKVRKLVNVGNPVLVVEDGV